ncbi:MAG: nuclear transport factor 2 family protein [Oscillospiraceae bacterium]|nr:nuclear transport factor 2 family protein [Oscillospiraceae bacterium]
MSDTTQARLDALERRLSELEARQAIGDLMGRYALLFTLDRGETLMEELWCPGEDISLEYGASGVYAERWKIKTYYVNHKIPGKMQTLSLSSPQITLSPDGRSAHGTWTAFGTETDAGDLSRTPVPEGSSRRVLFSSRTAEGQEYRAEILLQRYEVDFLVTDRGWRIQRLRVAELFRCPYDRDWVVYARERFETDGMWLESLFDTPMPFPEDAHGEDLPTRPSTGHWQYTPDALPGE